MEDVRWVIRNCNICKLYEPIRAAATGVTPIPAKAPLDQLVIDSMDFRAMLDGNYRWILQVKDPFSKYIWLYPLPDKQAQTVAAALETQLLTHGIPRKMQVPPCAQSNSCCTHTICWWAGANSIRRCDNGTELKAEVLNLCALYEIKVVNGRLYHPQSQGTVEAANRTFKNRLAAVQAIEGTRDWGRFLYPIALVINTIYPSTLPGKLTPHHAWYGRPYVDWPAWTIARKEAKRARQHEAFGAPADGTADEDSAGSESEEVEVSGAEDSEDDSPFFLSELGQKVQDYGIKVAERMVKKRGKARVLRLQEIVLLSILKRLRISAEPARIPARVIKKYKNVSKAATFAINYNII